MGRTDRERLKTQILNIDPRKVKLNRVEEAKAEIEEFDVKTIAAISLALGLFYIFVRHFISLYCSKGHSLEELKIKCRVLIKQTLCIFFETSRCRNDCFQVFSS